MADTTLHVAEPAKKPQLEDQLQELVCRTSAMEDALRGVVGVLYAIRAGDLLGNLPAERDDWPKHESALGMLDLLDSRAQSIKAQEEQRQWMVSCEISCLVSDAKAGKLRRFPRGDE